MEKKSAWHVTVAVSIMFGRFHRLLYLDISALKYVSVYSDRNVFQVKLFKKMKQVMSSSWCKIIEMVENELSVYPHSNLFHMKLFRKMK